VSGSTVNVYDGTTFLGAATVTGSTWTYAAAVTDATTYAFNTVELDAAGNASLPSADFAVTGDTSPPAAANTLAVTDATDTANSNTTNTATPTLTGVAEQGSTVGVYDSTGTFVANAVIDSAGNWSFTSTTLATGAHTFTVQVTDAAGNTDAAGSHASITLTVPVIASHAVDAVTHTSANYASSSNTLVLTGTNYATMLDTTASPAETFATDIKERLDWSKLVWDMNGDNGTTSNVTFTEADIASAKVSGDGTLTIILITAKANVLEANANYGGTATDMVDTIDIGNGFARDSALNAAKTDAKANAVLTIPTSADVAASALTAFDSFDATYADAAAAFASLQATTVALYVRTTAEADQSLVDANSFLAAAHTMYAAALAQMTAATALGAAAADTAETSDDTGAADRVALANTRLAVAATNLASAQRTQANMTTYDAAFHGDLFPGGIAANPVDGSTGDPDKVNSILMNEGYAASVTYADDYFVNKTNLETVLIRHSSGAKTLTFGTNFNASGATEIYSSAEGAHTITTAAVDRPINLTVSNPTGAFTFTGGPADTGVTLLMLSGAPTVTCGSGDNTMNIVVLSGAITASAGNGHNIVNAETTTGGAITIEVGNGNNEIVAMTQVGAITIKTHTGEGTSPPAGTESIKAYSRTGAVTVNIATDLQTSAAGSALDLITIETNTNASASTQGITMIHGSNGRHNIHSTTYNSAITIDTHDANDIVSASSGGGVITVRTGGGDDTIFVASGTGGAVIDGGTGTNTITLGAHSSVADTINARTAYATLVNGASIGLDLPDLYNFGSTTAATAFTALSSSTGSGATASTIAGTTTVAIDASGILLFDAAPTSTGAVFANEVLKFLEATSTTYNTVASYDDGINQWVFMATSTTEGRYIELYDTHDADFAGISGTATAHKILLGA
jgi:hypothetical protein